eukprot:Em0022g953a
MMQSTLKTLTLILTTQNDIIDILGDEVQDVASIEQITFVLRYVHHEGESYVVKESLSFAGFKEQHREMTGEAVASTILQKLDELGLNCDNLRGQGYDGSGSMAGIRKGASSIVLQKYPLATYIHCCSHILNLSIASSCSVVLVRNMMGTVSEVSKFFEHGKRQDKLEEVIESELPEVRKKRVKPLCRTRWVERHDSLEVFVELYPAIIGALSDIAYGKDSVSWNRETTSDANGLLSAIEKFSFLLALVVVYNILSYIKGLTVLLQQRSIDIVQGITLVQEVLGQLKELREELDDWNKIWFQMAVEIAEEVGTEKPSIPRMCSRQTQRSNVEADIPEVYYRRSLTAPFLDHLLQEMEDRFTTNAKVATLGLCLVPSTICKKDDWQTHVNNLASLYQGDLPAPLSLQTELHCWKHKWIHVKNDDLPESPIEALNKCDSRLFPNISTLLRIMSTIPVTSYGGGDYTEEFATYRIDTGVPGHDNQPVFLRKHLASLRVLASPVHQRVLSKKLEDHQFSLLLKASSPADKAWLLSVSAPHAASWLLVTPPSLDLNFEPHEL